jgi:hypothetical protein
MTKKSTSSGGRTRRRKLPGLENIKEGTGAQTGLLVDIQPSGSRAQPGTEHAPGRQSLGQGVIIVSVIVLGLKVTGDEGPGVPDEAIEGFIDRLRDLVAACLSASVRGVP